MARHMLQTIQWQKKMDEIHIYMHLICAPCESIHFVLYGFAWGTSVYLVEKQNRNSPNVKVLLHQILEFFSLLGHITNNNRKVSLIWIYCRASGSDDNHIGNAHTYLIILHIIFIFGYLWWIKEVEKALTLFSLNYRLCVFCPFLWFFL